MDKYGHIYDLSADDVRKALDRTTEASAKEDAERLAEYEAKFREAEANLTKEHLRRAGRGD